MSSAIATWAPDADALTKALRSIFDGNGSNSHSIEILRREKNLYESASFSEIVTCRLPDGTERMLLCKYQDVDEHSWSDVAYEAEVYRKVIKRSRLTVPHFYGSYVEAATTRTWLFMEYLEDGILLSEKRDPEAMRMAAQWLGQFHAEQQQHVGDLEFQFLKAYGAEFYVDCARRALEYAADLSKGPAWLPSLCETFEDLAPRVFAKSSMITHGDYFVHNLIWQDEKVYPIDWEFAAIDLGEIDLVCLTHGWSQEISANCELEYQKSRWPEGAPTDFDQTLGMARLCFYLYKLGTDRNWSNDPDGRWHIRLLQRTAAQMGMISPE